MSFAVGDRVKGYTATGIQLGGQVVRVGATALLLDCGKVISAVSAELIVPTVKQTQLTIFDALANPEPEIEQIEQPIEQGSIEVISEPMISEAIAPSIPNNSPLLRHLRLKVKVYQQMIDERMQVSKRRYEAAAPRV